MTTKGSESRNLFWHFSNFIHEDVLHLSLPDVPRAGLSLVLILTGVLTGAPRCLSVVRALCLTSSGGAGAAEVSRALSGHFVVCNERRLFSYCCIAVTSQKLLIISCEKQPLWWYLCLENTLSSAHSPKAHTQKPCWWPIVGPKVSPECSS